jgi:hypothetical protein
MATGLPRPDCPGLLYGPAKEQQFFRQGGFPGVGMTDDPEIAAAVHFSSMVLIQIIQPQKLFLYKKPGF